jgi:hypothetical protein
MPRMTIGSGVVPPIIGSALKVLLVEGTGPISHCPASALAERVTDYIQPTVLLSRTRSPSRSQSSYTSPHSDPQGTG